MLQQMRSFAKWIWIMVAAAFVGGFLFVQTSGLLGKAPITATTVVAKVNGEEINYQQWQQVAQQVSNEQQQRLGRALTMDEQKDAENQAFDQMVMDILLQQEYKKRDITVSDDEIRDAARYSPPPQFLQAPELQTNGRFDPDKYQRFLTSPAARQQGITLMLENYYRQQIPREKLFDQISSSVYVQEPRLWRAWRDSRDSAQISYVVFRPDVVPDNDVQVSDDEITKYYDAHKKEFDRTGRAVLSLVMIPRAVTAEDSAAVRTHILALRQEIVSGAKFEDVAKRESSDSGSAANGGLLPPFTKGRMVPSFEAAAFALKPGELSNPVLSPFGYHLIRMESRKGDTITVRHILLPIQQSDSSANRSDRRADSLANMAASQDNPAKFDEAAKKLGLTIRHLVATEGQPAMLDGKPVPSVSAWAFGTKAGESSDLIDSDEAYYLARVDSLTPGGTQTRDEVAAEIRRRIARDKKLDKLVPVAQAFADEAARTSLEAASKAKGIEMAQTPLFGRATLVPGIGQFTQPIGAAFGLPVGAVSAPIKANEGVFVERVDRRIAADSAQWVAQKDQQRSQMIEPLREQKIRDFLRELHDSAKIDDRRKQIQERAQRQTDNS